MYDVSRYTINLSAQFKPRAEANLLSVVVQNAWETKNKELEALRDELNVIDEILTLFARLYPVDDMAVLRRYGKAEMLKSVLVRIYNPDASGIGRYDLSTSIPIPEDKQILIPNGNNDLYAAGPRFSEDPDFGVNPEARARKSAGEWQEIVDYHTRADARRLPKATEVFFERVAECQNAYRREYRNVVQWPAEIRVRTGKYPTWAEIADEFPVVGDYIRKNLTDESRIAA